MQAFDGRIEKNNISILDTLSSRHLLGIQVDRKSIQLNIKAWSERRGLS